MYYYVLHVTNLFAMATMVMMYMVNFLNKLQKNAEKGHSRRICTMMITDRCCMYCVVLQLLSSKLQMLLSLCIIFS